MSDGADQTADYVLFYARVDSVPEEADCQMKEAARRIFCELATEKFGLVVDKQKFLLPEPGKESGGWRAPFQSVYWGFRAESVDVLLREAEFVKMELPLKAKNGLPLSVPDDDGSPPVSEADGSSGGCCNRLKPETRADGEDEMEQTDENADFISAPFIFTKKHLYYGGSGSEFRLRRAQRIYLTYSILNRIRIDPELRQEVESNPKLTSCGPSCMHCSSLQNWLSTEDCEIPITLEHLLESNVFSDAYALHDPTSARPSHRPACCAQASAAGIEPQEVSAGKFTPRDSPDLRHQLIRSWHCCCRFQPLRLIRMYFGERLAFYYAWFGYTIWCLLFLSAVGLAFFVYGLANASVNYKNSSAALLSAISAAAVNSSLSTSVASTAFIAELMQFILLTFENYLTIVFGCILTVWSLLTTQTWKRYQGSLSYRWDVNHNYIAENRRPAYAYVLRKSRCQPTCCTQQFGRRKCIGFYACVASCVIIVFAITVGFQTARLVSDQMYCSATSSGAACFIISTVLPIGGQVVIISVLDSLYSLLAKAVTNWEGHEYPTDYDNSFAIKAFAFRFANNYSPLFYIAFVRQGRISIGSLTDRCSIGGESIDCFNQLNIMTAGYMVGKSLLKSVLDISWPCLKAALLRGCTLRALRSLIATCCPCVRMLAYSLDMEILAELERQLISQADGETPAQQAGNLELPRQRHLAVSKENEMLLDEYLEKFVLYGFMVMFGSAFYLAPVAALLAMIIDLQLDSKRLLFIYRRPVPLQAQGIGIWNWMLDFINFAGIVTTGAILAFTSQSLAVYGVSTTDANRLIFFVIFENVMLAVKFLVAVSIADTPRKVKLGLKWEYYYVPKILADGRVEENVQDSLSQLHDKSRWFHALLPCCVHTTTTNPETGPHLV